MARSSRSTPLADVSPAAALGWLGLLFGAERATRRLRGRASGDPGGDNALRPAAKLYLAAVTLAAAVAACVAVADLTLPVLQKAALDVVAFAVAMTLAGLHPLPFSARTKFYLDTSVLVAAVLVFESQPPLAILIAATGTLLAHRLRRQPWDQSLFNSAQMTLLAAFGSFLAVRIDPWIDYARIDDPGTVLVALAVAAGMWLLNTVIVAPMVALQHRDALPRAWTRAAVGGGRIQLLAQVAEVVIGIIAAAVFLRYGLLMTLLLLPAGAVYQSAVHHMRLRREAEAQLRHQASHDPLTDLPNRALFLDRLEQALDRARRRGDQVAVLFVDLDRFKFVNDSLGHTTGDRLLVEVGQRLRASVRLQDTVARLGGDEFTVLLEPVSDELAVEQIAAGVVAALEAPFRPDGHEVTVTASVGIAIAGSDATDAARLLRAADLALYRVKQQGKARWAVFDDEMDAVMRERVALELQLQRAVGRGQLRLAYQPLIELATGRLVGVEALVRWEHPERGELPPDTFIPLAEESGLILGIGRWVLEAACRDARAWCDRYRTTPVVSVNLSARQFQRPELVEDIARALRTSGLEPGCLKLEITESAMMADADEAAATLRRLRALGVRIAIDDFGRGYSSLDYLRRFPVDQLKIDRGFVAGLGRDPGDTAIVRAVVGLAHAMGLVVVAEGVERAGQVKRLRELGCDLAQGYFFGPPVPPEAVTRLLATAAGEPNGVRLAVD